MEASREENEGSRTGRLTLSDFSSLLGTPKDSLGHAQARKIAKGDLFRFSELSPSKAETVVLGVLKRINSPDLTVAGDSGSSQRWERGWAENLRGFDTKVGFESLRPKYVRSGQPLRLFQRYIMPNNPDFEYEWYKIFIEFLARNYMSGSDTIYEFGCGSGINVAFLSQFFKNKKKVWGLDWAQSSVTIVEAMARGGYNVEGRRFNFFEPDESFKLDEGCTVLTVGALEQTGPRYLGFINYLLRQRVALCVNIEPIVEWYDQSRLVDYLAVLFHERRKYWKGFPALLEKLQRKGKVNIVKQKRSYFGSLYIEGYSQNVWKPLR